jgi:transcriptional regulator of met regulon
MWNSVMCEIQLAENVRETVRNARSAATQRALCAALARFVSVCNHLGLEWRNLQTWAELRVILTQVLDWAGRNGAKLYWIRNMRTAVSVLFEYKFGKQTSDDAVVKAVVHAHTVQQLPTKEPLQLNWELPELFNYIMQMGSNQDLTHRQLTSKCVALVMATTGARFTEIEQFSMNDTDPQDSDRIWAFNVRVKNREFKQPIVLHSMEHGEIDPVKAMTELRRRIRKKKRTTYRRDDTFWYDEQWNVMRTDELRAAAKQLLIEAGIDEHRPYHIKHAMVTWLSKQGIEADRIVRFIRHALGSTVYVQHYLAEDLGEKCTKVIESTVLCENPNKSTDKIANTSLNQQQPTVTTKRWLRSSKQ